VELLVAGEVALAAPPFEVLVALVAPSDRTLTGVFVVTGALAAVAGAICADPT